MLGPIFGGWGFALALQIQVIGFPFWTIMLLSGLACVLSLAVREGDGHEIKLEGEEEEAEAEAAEKLTSTITEEADLERRNDAGITQITAP